MNKNRIYFPVLIGFIHEDRLQSHGVHAGVNNRGFIQVGYSQTDPE